MLHQSKELYLQDSFVTSFTFIRCNAIYQHFEPEAAQFLKFSLRMTKIDCVRKALSRGDNYETKQESRLKELEQHREDSVV